jgi:hypothetical protein
MKLFTNSLSNSSVQSDSGNIYSSDGKEHFETEIIIEQESIEKAKKGIKPMTRKSMENYEFMTNQDHQMFNSSLRE